MIGDQIVDTLKQCGHCFAVVLFFSDELPFCENLNQIHKTVTSFTAKVLCIGCDVCDDRDYRLVDWFEKAWARVNQLVDLYEYQVSVSAGAFFECWDIKF